MLVEIDQLTKRYRGKIYANDQISLTVDAGEVFGLLGPNGAGKTTLVSQVVGLVTPTSGRITIAGKDIVAHPAFARQACALQPQAQVPISGLTLRQAIELVGRIRHGEPRQVRQRTADLVEALDLGQWRDLPGQRLSGGLRRLATFCMAAVTPGRLVVLDEPTNDVDPIRRRRLWQQVRQLAEEGIAVLLVTHNVLEAERSVDRLALIAEGRLVASGTPAALRALATGDLRLELVCEPGTALPAAPGFALSSVGAGPRLYITLAPKDVDAAVAWADALRKQGIVEDFTLGGATLEDVYIQVVGQTAKVGAAVGLETRGDERSTLGRTR